MVMAVHVIHSMAFSPFPSFGGIAGLVWRILLKESICFLIVGLVGGYF
jgi:hypothetical protein